MSSLRSNLGFSHSFLARATTGRGRVISFSLLALLSAGNLHCGSDSENGGNGGSTSQAGSAVGGGGSDAGGSGSGGVSTGGSGGAPSGGTAGGGASSGGGGASGGTASGGSGGMLAGAGGSGGATAGSGGGGGASGGSGGTGGGGAFTLTSSKLTEGATFAADYTCAAGNAEKSLPLSWTAGPSETKSYAIVFQDTNNNFNHWVVWDIPTTITALPEGLPNDATLSSVGSAKQKAGSGQGYLGPCPMGMLHTYVFTVYALDVATLSEAMASSSTMQLSAAIQMHDIASATLSGKSDAMMP